MTSSHRGEHGDLESFEENSPDTSVLACAATGWPRFFLSVKKSGEQSGLIIRGERLKTKVK